MDVFNTFCLVLAGLILFVFWVFRCAFWGLYLLAIEKQTLPLIVVMLSVDGLFVDRVKCESL